MVGGANAAGFLSRHARRVTLLAVAALRFASEPGDTGFQVLLPLTQDG